MHLTFPYSTFYNPQRQSFAERFSHARGTRDRLSASSGGILITPPQAESRAHPGTGSLGGTDRGGHVAIPGKLGIGLRAIPTPQTQAEPPVQDEAQLRTNPPPHRLPRPHSLRGGPGGPSGRQQLRGSPRRGSEVAPSRPRPGLCAGFPRRPAAA